MPEGMTRMKEKPRLGPLENEVMQVLWARGTATADDVRSALESTQRLKDSTVRTILRRLEGKSYVEHEVEGRTFIFRPKMAPQDVATQQVRGIIDRLCLGSVESLLVGMVDDNLISATELRKLAEKITEAERAAKTTKRRKK
jgi:BlaI family penicillinase repressor